MTRRLAAMTLFVLVLTGCKESPTAPLPSAPPGSAPTLVPPILMSSATIGTDQDAVIWNNGCFDSDDYERHWTFSDGSTADGSTISHRFSDPGTYSVTLVSRFGATEHIHTAIIQVVGSATQDSLQPQVRRIP